MTQKALSVLATTRFSVDEIAISVNNASVRFVRREVKDVTICVTDPANWQYDAKASIFRQKSTSGKQTFASAGGISVGQGAVFIGGTNSGVINTGTSINTNGGAFVGGSVFCGGDFIGEDAVSVGAKAQAVLECIEVILPVDYVGGLDLDWTGNVELDLGDWTSGSLRLNGSGSANITAGSLQGIEVFDLSMIGASDFTCKSLDASVFNYNQDGAGLGRIRQLQASIVNVTIGGVIQLSVNSGSAKSGSVSANGCARAVFTGDFRKLKTKSSITSTVVIK